MRILVLDNYDSFTYNLVHILRELGVPPDVYRNDRISLDAVDGYDKILLSPGPGIPDEAGIMKALIKKYCRTKSILGICLGHQGIGEIFGAELYNIPKVLHGVTSQVSIREKDEYLFADVEDRFTATHYHSWAIRPETIGKDLRVTATNDEGLVMGIRHADYDVRGLQFHPESIMTKEGPRMIKNWVKHQL